MLYPYYLNLWYPENALRPEDLKKFILKYEKNLHLKTNIKVGSDLATNDFIWYDLIDFYNVNKDGSLELTDEHYLKEEEFAKSIECFEDDSINCGIYIKDYTNFNNKG